MYVGSCEYIPCITLTSLPENLSATEIMARFPIITSESIKSNVSPFAICAPLFLANAGPLFSVNSIILHWYCFAIWTESSVLLSETTMTSKSLKLESKIASKHSFNVHYKLGLQLKSSFSGYLIT